MHGSPTTPRFGTFWSVSSFIHGFSGHQTPSRNISGIDHGKRALKRYPHISRGRLFPSKIDRKHRS
jgi:hypothetical protein